MRYLVQLLIPALILLGVIYAVSRSKQSAPKTGNENEILSTQSFLLILVIGAVFTVAVLFGVDAWTDF